jgi:hypothetical protein
MLFVTRAVTDADVREAVALFRRKPYAPPAPVDA